MLRATSIFILVMLLCKFPPLNTAASSALDALIAGKTLATNGPVFSTQDHTNSVYVRSPSCWLRDFDLSCVSPWCSAPLTSFSATLISPLHALIAKHTKFSYQPGVTIRFITSDNIVVNSIVSALQDLTNYDLTVCLLDAAVTSIAPAKVMAAGYAAKFPASFRVPAACFDQFEDITVMDLNFLSGGLTAGLTTPTDSQRLAFYRLKIVGDSGNPVFLIIRNQPVLLTIFTTPTAGADVAGARLAVNSAMTTLGGGYQLTTAAIDVFSDA